MLGAREKKRTITASPVITTPTPTSATMMTTASAPTVSAFSTRVVTSSKTANLKIPYFFGESGKGEVNYQTWCYDVKCLISKYHEDEILQAVQRSVKGKEANVLRRLGVNASVTEILKKFESIYSDIETKESVRKLYSYQQKKGEIVVNCSSRIEDIYAEALDLVTPGNQTLKTYFMKGCISSLNIWQIISSIQQSAMMNLKLRFGI